LFASDRADGARAAFGALFFFRRAIKRCFRSVEWGVLESLLGAVVSKLHPQRGLAPIGSGCRSALRGLVVALGLGLGVGGGGCGEADGNSGLYPGTVRYQSPAGDYEFNLLEPPWRETVIKTETVFVVPQKVLTLVPSEDGALYSLHIYRQNTDAASALQADAPSRQPNEGASGPVSVASGTGSTGVEMSWKEATSVYHRDAYITIATGLTFRMHFSGDAPLAEDKMVSQMIASFRPASAK
jgi:hypothetical protein